MIHVNAKPSRFSARHGFFHAIATIARLSSA
jgi:hypothetical protein